MYIADFAIINGNSVMNSEKNQQYDFPKMIHPFWYGDPNPSLSLDIILYGVYLRIMTEMVLKIIEIPFFDPHSHPNPALIQKLCRDFFQIYMTKISECILLQLEGTTAVTFKLCLMKNTIGPQLPVTTLHRST